MQRAGIVNFEDLGLCTYAEPERFFSYRRTTHLGEPDYGRHINAIALAGYPPNAGGPASALDSRALCRYGLPWPGGLQRPRTRPRRGVYGVELGPSRLGRHGISRVAFWDGVGRRCAMALAGCTLDGQPSLSAAQPRGATVAFESIDGPPPGQFRTLVQNLNDEAQTRRLAVISRESPSAYRVRGYLAAKVVKGQTTISWVWDVFDGDDRRALRISGEETAKWAATATPGPPPTTRCCTGSPAPAWSSSPPS